MADAAGPTSSIRTGGDECSDPPTHGDSGAHGERMLAVPADRLPGALADLDPGNRALLDLSLRRGVSDAEIGELLRKEPADVARGPRRRARAAGRRARRGRARPPRARPRGRRRAAGRRLAARAPAPPPPPPSRVRRSLRRAGARRAGRRGDRQRPSRASPIASGRPRRASSTTRLHFEPEERRSRRGGLLAAARAGRRDPRRHPRPLERRRQTTTRTSSGNGSPPAQNGGPAARTATPQKLSPVGGGTRRGHRGRHRRGRHDHDPAACRSRTAGLPGLALQQHRATPSRSARSPAEAGSSR